MKRPRSVEIGGGRTEKYIGKIIGCSWKIHQISTRGIIFNDDCSCFSQLVYESGILSTRLRSFSSVFMRICNSSEWAGDGEEWDENRNNNNKLNLISFHIIVQLLLYNRSQPHCHLSQSADLLARRWKFTEKKKTFHRLSIALQPFNHRPI